MIVENAFTIAASMEEVFDAILDLERLVPCLPGGRLDRVEGGRLAQGQVRLPLGRTSVTYRGTLRLVDDDRDAGAVTMAIDGHEARGTGRVQATVELRLRESREATMASLWASVDITGRAAAVDPEVVRRAAATLMSRFGSALATTMNLHVPAAPAATDHPAPTAFGEKPVPGRIVVVTHQPVDVPLRSSRAAATSLDRVNETLAERPWLIPASLLSLIALLLMLRRRDS